MRTLPQIRTGSVSLEERDVIGRTRWLIIRKVKKKRPGGNLGYNAV